MHFLASLLPLALAISTVAAHDHRQLSHAEISRRHAASNRCAKRSGEMNERRIATHKSKRSLAARSTNVTLHLDDYHYTTIQNDTCVLTPEVTTGPYIWHRSQTLRQDMTEDQTGVPLYLDIGVLDIDTCEPLPNVLVDLWHCNATGSYSSFDALSPNTPFETLLTELNKTITDDLHTGNSTWLRGLWPTDENGMMEMKTIFPGFYVERAIHIHVQVHMNWTLANNGTMSNDRTVSTGQLFFAEDLSEEIMALQPYASHTQINRTLNSVDTIYTGGALDNGFNPIMSVAALDGVDVTNGMVAYITLGVNTSTTAADSLA
ncbi:MAG: hypothetical protein M1834_001498 [Cirrosporium novae-zelandiae]|nr:MAG: hypothetical protein M1834_004015 [Cirrosporium novae-zelandiae]KAI9735484.1 MAG: hypothetical protein M1834_001498 [Cirrosporium novae-zelandiae]